MWWYRLLLKGKPSCWHQKESDIIISRSLVSVRNQNCSGKSCFYKCLSDFGHFIQIGLGSLEIKSLRLLKIAVESIRLNIEFLLQLFVLEQFFVQFQSHFFGVQIGNGTRIVHHDGQRRFDRFPCFSTHYRINQQQQYPENGQKTQKSQNQVHFRLGFRLCKNIEKTTNRPLLIKKAIVIKSCFLSYFFSFSDE